METKRDDALKDTMRTIFHSFDEQYVVTAMYSCSDELSSILFSYSFALWEAAVNCVCTLDVLCSMAVFRCVAVPNSSHGAYILVPTAVVQMETCVVLKWSTTPPYHSYEWRQADTRVWYTPSREMITSLMTLISMTLR